MRPQYQVIKHHICEHIEAGEWEAGHKVPSDNLLAAEFGVSRMTANRALRELSDEGVVARIAGVGTFVAEQIPQTPLLEVKNIADEIEERGQRHSSKVISMTAALASNAIASQLEVAKGSDIYRSVIVHYENGIPVQLEDRHVNAALVPEYIEQDFTSMTPNVYLTAVAPITEAEHVIEAILPDSRAQKLLEIEAAQPCLLVRRRTWAGALISVSRLIHPGHRYRIGGRFVPQKPSSFSKEN
ncbi:MAG: histidine utilization repressor [Pseudomonadota bacterium]